MAAPATGERSEDDTPESGDDLRAGEERGGRRRATLAVLPFLLLGFADVALILGWGVDPLWGFAILPPILFLSALAWIAFRAGFATTEP